MRYLLRYGEIGLKGRHVRRAMVDRMVANTARMLKAARGEGSFKEEEGRLFVETALPEAPDLLARVFGLVSFSPVATVPSEPEGMEARALELAASQRERGDTFAIRARRVGEHPYTSMDVARRLGAAVLAAFPGLKVDLDRPAWEVHLDIRRERAYLYTDVHEGPGGLPLGSQGRVVALVEAPEGALAAWLMMKRGCWVVPAFREEAAWAEALLPWNPDLAGHAIGALEEMGRLAERENALGYVYPWGVEAIRPTDLRPAFYPLLGMQREEREALRRRVLAPAGPA